MLMHCNIIYSYAYLSDIYLRFRHDYAVQDSKHVGQSPKVKHMEASAINSVDQNWFKAFLNVATCTDNNKSPFTQGQN